MIGKTLGNYQIMEELGRGGMAVVYRAYQASLNRHVAIKVLPPQLSFDQEFVERFQREAQAAAKLRHPNIVVIHDVGHQDGIYYIVMEYLEGRTLKDVIEREGSLAPERVERIVDQVASALDYARRHGFVHRDVKPSNIFVGEDDRATLTDFGIAKAASETQQLTRTGTLVGTPEYMSPEQAEGRPVDHRTDLYALGVVVYQMLVGRVPFVGTTPHATLHAVIYESPPPPRQLKPDLPPALEAVILKAIAKQPDRRFQRGEELAAAIKSALGERSRPAPAAGRPVAGQRSTRPPTKRRSAMPWLVAGTAVVLIALIALLAVLLLGGGDGGETPVVPSPTEVAAVETPSPAVDEATPTLEGSAEPAPLPTDTGTPTDTPEAPTDTPTLPTDTPELPTNTPEPPTSTPTPTPSATPTEVPPACPFQALGTFASLWQTYQAQLGCPIYQNPKVVQDAEQAFDNGHMFWRQDLSVAIVTFELGPLSGTFQAFVDMWTEGDPEYSCSASPPAGKVQPKRGFGAVWCSLGGPSAPIGWGLADEVGFGPGYGDPMVQDFQKGSIFRDSDGTSSGQAYVFFVETGKFIRVSY